MSFWLVETLVASTVLMLAVLAVRRPVAQLFGPRITYALWALPVLRLVLPPIPGWTAFYPPVARGHGPVMTGLTDTAYAATLPPLPITAATIDWVLVTLLVWAAGAAVWIGWQALRYHVFLRGALAAGRLLTRQGGTEIWITPAVDGPMAAGVMRPRIFLPADFQTRYSPGERRLALLHEGAHHDRGDLLANFIGLAAVALHWWNPIAHKAWRAFRADQELACDATVLAGAAPDLRIAYGSAVLKSACSRTPAAACAMNHKSQLKQRIVMMKDRPMGVLRHLLGGLCALLLVGGGLLVTASAAPPVAPVAPAAPVAPVAPALIAPPVAPVAVPPAAPVRVRPVRSVTTSTAPGHDWATVHDSGAAHRSAVRAEVAASLAAARAQMSADCAAAGTPVAAGADMRTLATCGPQFKARIHASVRKSLAAARWSVEASEGLDEDRRDHALDRIDKAMAKPDPELASLDTNYGSCPSSRLTFTLASA
ncbi:hypothetical protein GCM10011529_18260 [Polymorphobacter glacialis]|uniref:Peptidase M56 domain-containing protein n=1 Tax=Sandarakinorhabdus glacialis TaxID=1614636 RepID=A0A916ZTT0_9SPHN|nr:M56 family metallopeptidase [Polymorphobacter glacialis]GGE12256.1 hypothetical protein GCM10011529_18260 [Polymorphobacter glacialis]